MQEYKPIHFNLFKPHKSLFKESRNGRAIAHIVSCCNNDNCGMFKRDECIMVSSQIASQGCPYGKRSRYEGFSHRASKYHSWINEQEKRHEGIGSLKSYSHMMAIIGDYIFLPYPHINLKSPVPFLEQAGYGFFSNGCMLLKKEDFTVDNIIKLIHFRPQALFGGEISAYQQEVPPKFLKHLSEQMPDLFSQVIEKDEYAKKRYQEFTNIGRKALLETTTPNIGKFKDIHGGLWEWTGKELRSTNSHASFLLIDSFKELILIPDGGQEVTITDEGQVNKDTVFVD